MRNTLRNFAVIACGLACLQVPGSAAALDWDRLWLNNDQRGAEKMEKQQYAEAAETFEDERWKAAALYRSGDYRGAAEAWKPIEDVESQYNRGNALARSGDLEAAIAAYESVLERAPDHVDARYNLEMLREMMQESRQSEDSKSLEKNREQEGAEGRDSNAKPEVEDAQRREGEQQESRQDESGEMDNEGQSGVQSSQPPIPNHGEQAGEERQGEPQTAGGSSDGRAERQDSSGQDDKGPDQARTSFGDIPDVDTPEQQVAMEQWLRRIPDDPGGLLRRKFLYQYRNRHGRKERVGEPW